MLLLILALGTKAEAQVKFRPVSSRSVIQDSSNTGTAGQQAQPATPSAASQNAASQNAATPNVVTPNVVTPNAVSPNIAAPNATTSSRTNGDTSPVVVAPPTDIGPSTGQLPQANLPASPPVDISAMAASLDADKILRLDDVIASLYRYFPVVQQAILERSRAGGQIVGAYGAYDTKLQGYTLNEPTGFYRNYRNGIGLARQTWWGTYLSAGYRIGRGEFQPWYKERETNKSGEFKLAMEMPLLQGRAIDSQRVAVFQAMLAQQSAEPMIQEAILNNSIKATSAYWEWIAAGAILKAQRELLQLAETRGKQFEIGVKAEKYAEIDLIFNQQLIAERRAKAFESEQKFRASSFKLSLFLRDEAGQTIVPNDEWLPEYFPDVQPIPPTDFQADLSAALNRRPEPQLLRLEIQQIQYDRQLATNNLLPRIDTVTEASQDAGQRASSSNDKGRFELMVGLQGEVPLQRRYAKGKIQETAAKIAQLNEKLRLQQDKIAIELQTAQNALVISLQVIQQAEITLTTALDTLSRYRFGFERGKVDLIYINLLESKVNEAEIKLVNAQRDSLVALAELQAALGLDPMDQAMIISSLPISKRPGPGHLPEGVKINQDQFDRDWKIHAEPAKP